MRYGEGIRWKGDNTARLHRQQPDEGDGHGEQPRPKPALVAHVGPVRDRAHGAEVGFVRHRANNNGNGKDEQENLRMNVELHKGTLKDEF